MLYSLIMLLTVHGHTDSYVVDYNLTRDDCLAMLEQQVDYEVRKARVIQVNFICEKMSDKRK